MPNMENFNTELELTYLATCIPAEVQEVTPEHLLDVYIPENPDMHSHLRLRQRGDKYEITKKVPIKEGDPSAQIEYNIPLDAKEFTSLSLVSNKRIEKDRYDINIEGNPAEVDIFMGALKGLVLIDFEFSSDVDKQTFTPPSCCLVEVTEENFIAGGNLAGKSYNELANDLARFNYRPLQCPPTTLL